jgi:hypothetical protein
MFVVILNTGAEATQNIYESIASNKADPKVGGFSLDLRISLFPNQPFQFS